MSLLIPFFTRCLALVVVFLTVSATAQTPLAITDFQLDLAGRAVVRVPSEAGFYFILYRGDEITAIQAATDVESLPSAGDPPSVELIDARPPTPLPSRFYRVERVPLATPKDADADGIDDVFELNSRPLLDPLNPADAALDPDNDGRSTLEEYRAGTNPFVANPAPAPASPRLSPPASSTTGGRLELTGFGIANTYIRVEGGAALATNRVGADGAFLVSVPLSTNRINRLFVTAVNPQGNTSPGVPIEILQDSQPPTLHVDFPTNRMSFTTANTLVAGRVGDSLSGYAGLSVWVHASPAEGNPPLASTSFPPNSPFQATVDVGIGPNGTYERADVPLVEGTNIVSVVAMDALGNRTVRRAEVIRRPLVGPRLVMRSGDRQMTNVLRRLEQPLVVRAENPDGSPIPNVLLTLDVTRSDGRLLPANTNALASDWTLQPNATTNGAMVIQVRTDANGEAAAWWTLGSEAGCANNRVCVTSGTLDSCVYFCASAMGNPGRQINIGSGNHQKVETGGATVEPLRAWVSDGLNPAAGVPVTFRVVEGNGRLVEGGRDGLTLASLRPSGAGAEGSSLTVGTGRTGHASVGFVAGSDAGQNVIEASFPGQFGLPATFIVYGVARDLTQPATFTGLILDNTSCPIGNAYCELEVAHYKVGTFSDSQGRFRFENVPGGMGHLHVNGRTATSVFTNAIPTNSFPALHYSVTTVPNAENSLPSPVLLPRLNPANAHVYDGTKDLVLTCEGIDGLRMTIRANSMRDAQGNPVTPANPMVVSLDQVHHDDVPMPMPDGVAPAFAWTLQPGGATFDPPVAIEYPNMSGLPPGSIAYFLSFNHDTERFEIVSSGHITSDGSTIVTDPGSGLTLAGWGCNCPPYSVTGECLSCPGLNVFNLLLSLGSFLAEFNPYVKLAIAGMKCGRSAGSAFDSCGVDFHELVAGRQPNEASAGDVRACVRHVKNTILDCYLALVKPSHGSAASKLLAALDLLVEEADQLSCGRNRLIEVLAPIYKGIVRKALIDMVKLANAEKGRAAAMKYLCGFYDLFDDLIQLEQRSQQSVASLLGPLESGALTLGEAWSAMNRETLQYFVEEDSYLRDLERLSEGVETINLALLPILAELPINSSVTEAWVRVGSQSGTVNEGGVQRVPNVQLPDSFGEDGPGSAPDFISDDTVRWVATIATSDRIVYGFSEQFRITQGRPYAVTNLTFTDTPPRQADRLTIAAVNSSLQAGGSAHPLQVTATYADGTTADVTLRTAWTSYRVSNPNLATLSPDGLLTPKAPGTVFVTAMNEAATAVQGFTIVSASEPVAGIAGRVVDTNGQPVVGARIVVQPAEALQALSTAEGGFEFAGVPVAGGSVNLRVVSGSGTNLSCAWVPVTLSKGLITDVGRIALREVPVPAGEGLLAWWGGDLGFRDGAGTNDLVALGSAIIGPGVVGDGYTLGVGGGHLEGRAVDGYSISNQFTVAGWIRSATDRNPTLVSQYDTSRSQTSWWFGFEAGKLALYLYAGNPISSNFRGYYSAQEVLRNNEWMFVAATVDLRTWDVVMYVDGVRVDTTLAESTTRRWETFFKVSTPIQLGAWVNSRGAIDGRFVGALDEITLWTRALSIAEVENLYRRSCRDPNVVTVTGRLVGADGAPVPGARVSASVAEGFVETGPDGRFALSQVPVGSASVRVIATAKSGGSEICAQAEVVPTRPGVLETGDLIATIMTDPPRTDLIGWWSGNEGLEDGAETNALTAIGWQRVGSGRIGTGLRLDGTTGYFTASWSGTGTLSNQFSFGAWIRPEALPAQQSIACQYASRIASNVGWYLGAYGSSLQLWLYERGWGGRGHLIATQSGVLKAGEWRWVGFSVNLETDTVVMMVDGQPLPLAPNASVVPWERFNPTTTPLLLGTHLDRNGRMTTRFRGNMDEVMLWRRALTVEELAAVAQRGCGTVGVNLSAE